MEIVSELKYLTEVVFTMLLGGIIGIEREFPGKPGGLSTPMLVFGSATLLMIAGDNMIKINTLQQYEIIIGLDPIGLIQ